MDLLTLEHPEMLNSRRYVRPSDRRLDEVVAQAAARIDLDTSQHRCSGTGVTTERSTDGTKVTASCVIQCSVKEMKALLAAPTSDRFAFVMRELVGPDFIYGAIVHHATPNLTVRTTTFVKRHKLARNEQWCFASAVKTVKPSKNQDADGFTVTQTSLHPDDVFTGKAQTASVVHIQGLSAIYLVTAEAQGAKRAVRVTFNAHAASTSKVSPFRWLKMNRNREEADDASNGAVAARAVQLAHSLKQLNTAVRRRRLDAQVFADFRKVQPTNSRCACCTRRVGGRNLFKKAKEDAREPKRCQLCGFLVCDRCVCTVDKSPTPEESLNTPKGIRYSQTVHLCEHCMQRVDDADYDNYCASSLSSTGAFIQPDGPDAEPPSAVIARALSQVLIDASEDEKPAVIRVIKHLLNPKKSKPRPELTKSLDLLADERSETESETNQTDDSSPLADSSGRQYALQYRDMSDDSDDSGDTEAADISVVSRFPVPADESNRLQWLDTHPDIISHVMDLPDLELLCNIAREELQCDASVNIIGPEECHVVAATDPFWRGVTLPREETMCTHTLMTGEPLLVRYPEADVRFTAMNAVRRHGLRFYFGFPVKIALEGGTTAVGTFCCAHGETRDVSESQYALMATLTEGVNRIIESRSRL